MIDAIQGPPRSDGADVLLRQTSFRALDEQRLFREADGTVASGTLRVRFGEVESRGVALTPSGRDRYDAAMSQIDALRPLRWTTGSTGGDAGGRTMLAGVPSCGRDSGDGEVMAHSL